MVRRRPPARASRSSRASPPRPRLRPRHPVEVAHRTSSPPRSATSARRIPGFDERHPVTDREAAAELIEQIEQDLAQGHGRRRRTPRGRRRRERRRGHARYGRGPGSCCCSWRSSHRSPPTRWRARAPRSRPARHRRVRPRARGAVSWRGSRSGGSPREPTPCCYPIAGMLGGLGLAMLYRLIAAAIESRTIRRSGSLIGLAALRADARARARRPATRRLHLHDRSARR